MESKAIRLTNKTAVALRENAKKTRNVLFGFGVVGTLALLALAVYWGMRWLPAVPLLIAAAVAMDALLALTARRMYLQLVGQAICTEAAARQMRGEKNEKERRRQAVDDLVAMQRDAQRQTEPASDEIFADALGQTRRVPAVKPAPKPPETTGGHRRRRQAGFTVIIDDSTKQVQ